MDVLLGLLFGLVAFAYLLWAFVTPFVVFGLSTRVTDLERRLKTMQSQLLSRRSTEQTPVSSLDPASPVVASSSSGSLASARSETEVESKPTITPPKPPTRPVSKYIERLELRTEPTEPAAQIGSPSIPIFGTLPASPSEPETRSAPPAPPQAVQPTATVPVKSLTATSEDEPSTLEEILAGKWLTWVGALAVIIGAGFGFKYAVENNWIGPRERVLIGIFTGLACFVGGTFAISRKYVFLAQGLTGSGLGILYLSLYAAFGWYGILSYETAFIGMILTTTLGLSFAGYFNVQPTAVLGMLGGFLTPAMLWPAHDPMWTLFPYLLMLDLGVLLIAGVRRWAGLEILAFSGTLIIWFSWQRQFYVAEHLTSTMGFMTAFLVLFALLSVWHNVIRKRTAMAGDFFLILVTPVAYFAALYALTFERFPQWQSEFSLSIMLFYALLAGLAALWHPAGKSVIAALAGLAATFLILAAPLELTGHWVTICWITQGVLLVELGFYFRQKALLWTGLALLAKVQVILLIYFLGTLADPVHFRTEFVRIQLHLIGRPVTPIDSAGSWMSLINGRSLSYLADVIAFGVLAWELGRRQKDTELMDALLPEHTACELWLSATVPIMALAIITLETFVWATVWKWDIATLVSAWTMWTALFACGLILWSRVFRSRGIEGLGWLLFGLLVCYVGYEALEALTSAVAGVNIPPHRLEAWWLINPRGLGYLTVILAAGLVSLIYSAFPSRETESERTVPAVASEYLMQLFGSAAFVLGLGMVLLETRVWAAKHHWYATTTLSACADWMAVFLLGAVIWRVWRCAAWVEKLVLTTFACLSLCLVANTFVTMNTLSSSIEQASEAFWNLWLFNARGSGYLVAVVACILGALLDRRMTPIGQSRKGLRQGALLGVGAYVMALVTVVLETTAWGYPHGWLIGTLFSGNVIWISIFLVGLVAWSVWHRTSTWDGLVGLVFLGLLVTLFVLGTGSGASVATSQHISQRAFRLTIEDWCLNPRFISSLVSIIAAGISAWLYRGPLHVLKISEANAYGGVEQKFELSSLFAIVAYLTGIAMLTLEFFVQGTSRDWHTTTSLAITLVWTTYATLTLIAGIYWHAGWVRAFSLGLFLITVGKVFLFDVWYLDTVIRVFAFISLGVALLLVSFLYRRYRERIRSWIVPVDSKPVA